MSQYPGTVLSLKIQFSRVSSSCFVTTPAPKFSYTALAVKTALECRSPLIGWLNRAGAPWRPSRRWRHLGSRALTAGGVPAWHPTRNDFLNDSLTVPRSKTSALPKTAPNNNLDSAGRLGLCSFGSTSGGANTFSPSTVASGTSGKRRKSPGPSKGIRAFLGTELGTSKSAKAPGGTFGSDTRQTRYDL